MYSNMKYKIQSENDLVEYINIFKRTLIYGAGMVGGLVLKRLLAHKVQNEKIFFVTSEIPKNIKYLEFPILCIDNIKNDAETVFIISVMKENQDQIVKKLDELEINNYIVIDEKLYKDLEKNYIKEYLNRQKSDLNCKDVLFCASDNNSSSGAFLCMVDLNKELNKRRIKTLVVLPKYGDGEDLLITNNIDYTFVMSEDWTKKINDMSNNIYQYENAVSELISIIKKSNIKLVHNNTTYTYVGAQAAVISGIPYVWHIRENIKEQGYWFEDETKSYNLINGSERIITVSNYVGECYSGFDKKKVQIEYDGIDINRFIDYHNVLTQNTIRILMPGSITPLKGQMQLLEAAVILKSKGLKIKISFVGNGDTDYIDRLKKSVLKNGLKNSILFYERTNKIECFYQNSDIVVVCSRSEAFGRVTVEAQLSGCLVIGAKCGATCELIDDYETGIFYKLNDAYDLADKICWAEKNHNEVKNIICKARENAAKNFSKEKNANNIIDIYTNILNDSLSINKESEKNDFIC